MKAGSRSFTAFTMRYACWRPRVGSAILIKAAAEVNGRRRPTAGGVLRGPELQVRDRLDAIGGRRGQ
eukprot:4026521-Pyramimonas_sp.AAC.1